MICYPETFATSNKCKKKKDQLLQILTVVIVIPADREALSAVCSLDETFLVSTYGQSSMKPVEQRIFVLLIVVKVSRSLLYGHWVLPALCKLLCSWRASFWTVLNRPVTSHVTEETLIQNRKVHFDLISFVITDDCICCIKLKFEIQAYLQGHFHITK